MKRSASRIVMDLSFNCTIVRGKCCRLSGFHRRMADQRSAHLADGVFEKSRAAEDLNRGGSSVNSEDWPKCGHQLLFDLYLYVIDIFGARRGT